jgi:hypothetical protein
MLIPEHDSTLTLRRFIALVVVFGGLIGLALFG